MNIKGQVVAITPLKQVNDKLAIQQIVIGWKKEVKGNSFDQKTAFDLKRTEKFDSIKRLEGIKVGDTVEVSYNEPISREYNGNYYTSVEAWGIKKEGSSQGGGSNENDSENLPF